MNDICAVTVYGTNTYTLVSDQASTGGVRVAWQNTANSGQDTVSISDAGKILAAQIAAMRDEQAK